MGEKVDARIVWPEILQHIVELRIQSGPEHIFTSQLALEEEVVHIRALLPAVKGRVSEIGI